MNGISKGASRSIVSPECEGNQDKVIVSFPAAADYRLSLQFTANLDGTNSRGFLPSILGHTVFDRI